MEKGAAASNVLVFEAIDDLDNLMICLKDRGVIP